MLPINIKDQRFGRLVARALLGIGAQGAPWRCDCDCSGTAIKTAKQLLQYGGHTRHSHPLSCGCCQGGRDRITLPITNKAEPTP